jgi:hypothetical protein
MIGEHELGWSDRYESRYRVKEVAQRGDVQVTCHGNTSTSVRQTSVALYQDEPSVVATKVHGQLRRRRVTALFLPSTAT